jgi:hypothetical protein
VPMRIDDYELRVPTLEDMLFHLCVHLEGHLYSELVLFADIAELLHRRRDEIDWPAFVDMTRGYRSESSVYYVLLLTERLLGAAVPADVLRELEPPYFHGALLAPLYGNLNTLHVAIDEIRLAASPPQAVLDDLERVTRRQAARAYRLEAELDSLATRFLEAGGNLIVFDGSPSARLFPDAALPAFEPLHAFVLEGDVGILREALPAGRLLTAETVDPALAGEAPSLRLEVDFSPDLADGLLVREEPRPSNVASALRSLRDRLGRSAPDDRDATARLSIHALSAEALVVCVAARAGSADEERLFRLVSLLELIRGLDGEFDAAQVMQLARRHDVGPAVSAALLIAGGLGDGIPAADPPAGAIAPRVLEWARYGPSSLKRYPWLRQAYYFAFVLLATRGAGARLAYVRRALTGTGGQAVLPSIARQMIAGAVRSRGASTRSLDELAHWLDPETTALVQRQLEGESTADRPSIR